MPDQSQAPKQRLLSLLSRGSCFRECQPQDTQLRPCLLTCSRVLVTLLRSSVLLMSHVGLKRPLLTNRDHCCIGLFNPHIVMCTPNQLAEVETEAHNYLATGFAARKQESQASARSSLPSEYLSTSGHGHQQGKQPWPVGQSPAGLCTPPCSWGPTLRHPPRIAFCWFLILHVATF